MSAATGEPLRMKWRIVTGPVGQQAGSPSPRWVGYPSVTVSPVLADDVQVPRISAPVRNADEAVAMEEEPPTQRPLTEAGQTPRIARNGPGGVPFGSSSSKSLQRCSESRRRGMTRASSVCPRRSGNWPTARSCKPRSACTPVAQRALFYDFTAPNRRPWRPAATSGNAAYRPPLRCPCPAPSAVADVHGRDRRRGSKPEVRLVRTRQSRRRRSSRRRPVHFIRRPTGSDRPLMEHHARLSTGCPPGPFARA